MTTYGTYAMHGTLGSPGKRDPAPGLKPYKVPSWMTRHKYVPNPHGITVEGHERDQAVVEHIDAAFKSQAEPRDGLETAMDEMWP